MPRGICASSAFSHRLFSSSGLVQHEKNKKKELSAAANKKETCHSTR